ISLAVPAAGWVGFVHPEITPPSNFHHLRDTTARKAGGVLPESIVISASNRADRASFRVAVNDETERFGSPFVPKILPINMR
ncbi:hypothetical protein, partial [Roseovarius sp. MBR-79]